MKTKFLASFTFLFAIFAFCSGEVLAQAPQPVVTRVEVVYSGPIPQTLNIYGTGFGTLLQSGSTGQS